MVTCCGRVADLERTEDADLEWIGDALLRKDLGAYPTEHLCWLFASNLCRVVTAIAWALDDQRRPAPEVLGCAFALAQKEPRVHTEIAQVSEELAGRVVSYIGALRAVARELHRRAQPGAIAVWKSVTKQEESLDALLKAIEVDRLLDYANSDPRDLQQEAQLGAGQEYGRQVRKIAGLIPPDFELLPIETSLVSTELRGERWEFWRATRRGWVQMLVARLLPLVTARFSRIKAAGRNAYREKFERGAAKKRGGKGGRHAKATGTEQERATHVSLNVAALENLLRSGAPQVEDQIALRQQIGSYYRIMERSHGKQGRRLMEALEKGANHEEAARQAGISSDTAKRWLKKLPRL